MGINRTIELLEEAAELQRQAIEHAERSILAHVVGQVQAEIGNREVGKMVLRIAEDTLAKQYGPKPPDSGCLADDIGSGDDVPYLSDLTYSEAYEAAQALGQASASLLSIWPQQRRCGGVRWALAGLRNLQKRSEEQMNYRSEVGDPVDG